ncbi:MAG: ribosome recycling factor [Rickettsiaceae bacterium]|nr:ribosome recycling factor [Rickettsiaceae bacterium]
MHKEKLLSELQEKMAKAIKVLGNDLKGLRTGRASINMLDPVVVEAYGDRMHLSSLGTVTTPDPRMIVIQVWDKVMIKPIEKAIIDANLGLNPSSDGQNIRLPVPPLNEERRKELAKLAAKYGENAKIALRNVRRDGIEEARKLEKASLITEDGLHSISDEIQKLTDKEVKNIDQIVKTKEKEITEI